ncbi:hypothetical protein BDV96DRAFT_650497 [Lophiotrema nucula]|uniref:Uncharacterized protein n=1 Tax=Lophiotrema nucula TaxID=690887 RepID=A0A6A5YV14_9PLEO|nr:hypothetical protein BDV96DRAFT_650497 [Lophiotrema nucula]
MAMNAISWLLREFRVSWGTNSPVPWCGRPILVVDKKRNDIAAKRAVIKEIEQFWDKNFIKHYVPQTHRPLVKRRPSTTRNIPRFPENDPKRWNMVAEPLGPETQFRPLSLSP